MILDRLSSPRKESNQSLTTTSSVKTPFKAMAGSGSAIEVSEEKVKEMGRILDKPSASSTESVLSQEMISAAKTPSIGMFRTAGSGSSLEVSEERVKEMGMILDRPSSSNNESILTLKRKSSTLLDIKTTTKKKRRIDFLTEGVMPTPTPLASFQTPRLVTVAKNDPAKSSAMFQTAGTGKAIEVSEETIEEMGVLLKKSSSFSNQLTEEKNRHSQKFAKVTDLADKNNHQRSLTNPDHHFVEANLRSYPHSPLRTNNLKSSNFNFDTVAYTPLMETKATPINQLVRGGSFKRLAYGVTPSSTRDVPSSYLLKDGMIQLRSLSENQELYRNAVDIPHQKQNSLKSPNEFKIPSKSANVTGSGNDVLHRKQQVEKIAGMTPVPINFSSKIMDTLDSLVKEQTESNFGELSPDSSHCQTLEDAIRHGFMSNCPSMCRLHGVREATILVNCNNSLQLRFDLNGTPQKFELNEKLKCTNNRGSLADIRQSLIDEGCDISRINDKWIRNHTRWIIWKLASYERRFSRFLAGKYLTYHNFVQNLLLRFQQEVLNGIRPAIRKIVNRDVAASKMMILAVCQILSSPKVGDDALPQSTVLELSDGWYSVRGCLDSKLSQFVKDGLITVGTKLLISSARLVGAEDGVDPLDEGDGTGCQKCKATLQLTANATRLARWNAKLGFVKKMNNQQMPHGRLLVKRISDIVPGGGNIPAIRLFIKRVYPMLYYEKCEHSDPSGHNSESSVKRRVFTEQEEDTRRRAFEARKLRVMEKLTDRIQGEVEQVRFLMFVLLSSEFFEMFVFSKDPFILQKLTIGG